MTASFPGGALRGTVHFMGAAGAGMISLAELFARSGIQVTGCDLHPDPAVRALEAWGCHVDAGHDPGHLDGVSALVITAAVSEDHPEILRARELGIPVLKRAEALGAWVNRGTVVAVAGTHGKTTTTAMVTEVLVAAGMDPTGLVGGRVVDWGSNLRMGRDDLFVVEADEYDRSFHQLAPAVSVLTNLEPDHLDFYGDLAALEESFLRFLSGMMDDGSVVACGDDHGVGRLLPAVQRPVTTYGLNPGSQLHGINVVEVEEGTAFDVVEKGESRGRLSLGVPGMHNVRNALAAAGAARCLGVAWKAIREGLERFHGVGRRFEVLGTEGGVTVVDDYAHHPTEIRATLEAARGRFVGRRIVTVFQPHLFSRTRDFAPELGAALAGADGVWVTAIYPAREEPIPGVTGMMVVQSAMEAGAPSASYHPELSELSAEILPALEPGDVCLTMGAGSIEFLGGDLLAALRSREETEVDEP